MKCNDFDRGTRQRGFVQNTKRGKSGSNRSSNKRDRSWEDTPLDIEQRRKEAKRVHAIQQKTNVKLTAMGLPTVEERSEAALDDDDDDDDEEDDGHARSALERRPLSLFEMHQQKLRTEYENALKEWKQKKKRGEKVGPKPVFQGVKTSGVDTTNDSYSGTMDSFYHAQNPVLTTSRLRKFVDGGTVD
mmetsp:Transcript_40076/g.65718  ORF Transcript_40076/g.65718 Transcript_40076/m.65718 type:complete len:188 (+) Transcript_40076:3-566(+)